MNTAAKVFLVLLRIAIGWHFLYEGVWKIASDTGAGQQYTSRYFLQASVARLRDSLADPPSAAATAERLDLWQAEVVKYFKAQGNPLSEEQKGRLAALCGKIAEHAAEDDAGGFGLEWTFLHENVLQLAADQDGRQYFSSEDYLRQAAGPLRPVFRSFIGDADGLSRLTKESAQAAIEARYKQVVDHFQSRGYPLTPEQRTKLAAVRDRLELSIAATLDDRAFQARLADYRALLARVRADGGRLTAPFSRERLAADRTRLDAIAAELLAFVNEPLIELSNQVQALETVDQMRAGPPPHPSAPTVLVDWAIKTGLSAIGLCLILGLFTPIAAAAAALQLLIFYFASPPWPSLPAATLGGHYLYVDRNVIEMLAALVLIVIPTPRLERALQRAAARFRSPEKLQEVSCC